jgi:hypothetical protein
MRFIFYLQLASFSLMASLDEPEDLLGEKIRGFSGEPSLALLMLGSIFCKAPLSLS